MFKKAFLLTIMLFVIVILALPTGAVAAKDNLRTAFTGKEGGNLCYSATPDPRCSPGIIVTLPNGKTYTHDMIMVIQFQASDPRFTGGNLVNFSFYPGTGQVTPGTGKFHLKPYTGNGYWEGEVALLLTPDGVRSVYTARGFGDLAGLTLQGTNNNGSLSGIIFERTARN